MPSYRVVGRRSRSRIADTEGCLKFAAFKWMTQGGGKEGAMKGLSVLWPSWRVLPTMICVVPKSSSLPMESASKSPVCPRLSLLLLLFFLPFGNIFLRDLSIFFIRVVGVVFANNCSSKKKSKISAK